MPFLWSIIVGVINKYEQNESFTWLFPFQNAFEGKHRPFNWGANYWMLVHYTTVFMWTMHPIRGQNF